MPVRIKEKLEREIQHLDHELNVELPAELKRAVALGDLSENAEYHMAKQRQEFVMARLGQLKKRLADLSMVNLANIPHHKVGYGSIVQLLNLDTDEPVEYHLVSSEEADATRGFISTSSPIGRGLLGKEVGEAVHIETPGGAKEFEVRKLVTIHEREDDF